MERTKGRPLASPQAMTKTDAPRPRRKLQKSTTKQRGQVVRRPASGASNEASTDNKSDTATKRPFLLQPCQPLPDPDLSDAKWSEYLRDSGYLEGFDLPTQPPETSRSPVNIIPELSHLAVNHVDPRVSLDKLGSDSLSSTPSSSSTMRRLHAKTPVFSIGQLEADKVLRPRNALASNKESSSESIADQYKALLESCNPIYTDSHSEPPPSRQEHDKIFEIRRQHSSDDVAGDADRQRTSTDMINLSPTSDDGTLVAFEEETVYFKPVSFSPEPTSPAHFVEYLPIASPSPAPDNLSLQICLDLLTRDLASAVTSRPNRSSPEASALQIWVMIEAYERLRDRFLDTRLRNEHTASLETMFDMWLRALYTIHDSMTCDRRSESDYDALESEDLD